MVFSLTPGQRLWGYCRPNPDTSRKERYARLEGNRVVSPSGNTHEFDAVLVDGQTRFADKVRRLIDAESIGSLPDWLDIALLGWDIRYVFETPEVHPYSSAPKDLPISGWSHVERRVFGRAVQHVVWSLINEPPTISHQRSCIYLGDYTDPGLGRQWHLQYKSGEKREVSHEFAWNHIGLPLGSYGYVYDPEGMSQARID